LKKEWSIVPTRIIGIELNQTLHPKGHRAGTPRIALKCHAAAYTIFAPASMVAQPLATLTGFPARIEVAGPEFLVPETGAFAPGPHRQLPELYPPGGR